MGEVRRVRPLDGEASGHERLIEQLAAMKDVREEPPKTISTLSVELDPDAASFQASLCELSGRSSVALGCNVGMSDLRSVQADQPHTLSPSVEEHVDSVAVRDRSYRSGGIVSAVGRVRLQLSLAGRPAQCDGGEDDCGSPLHAAQPMAG